MATTDARPIPRKNAAYRHYFAIRKNDGSLITTWTGADSELSKDGGNYADATNEATEIQTSGTGYIDLTAAEMNADAVVLKVTVTNADALPYLVTLFPEEVGDIRTDVVQISGDSAAADNLELMFDGTGYAGGTTRLQVAAPDAETILDKLDDTLEDDAGTYRFTTNALEQAPTGGSSGPTAIEIRQEIDTNSTQLAAIVADTDELQQDDLPGLIAALNDISAAEVNAEVDTALADIHLDHLLAVAESDTPVDDSIIAKLASTTGDWSTFVAATDSLQAIREEGDASWNGSGATAAEVRAEIDANSTQLAAIVADTNEIQQDLVNGGRIDTILDSILADTSQLQNDLADGGRLDGLIDAIKAKTDAITLTGSLVQVVLHDATAAGLATFVTVDTGETSAASGSVADLAGGTVDEQAIAAAVAARTRQHSIDGTATGVVDRRTKFDRPAGIRLHQRTDSDHDRPE